MKFSREELRNIGIEDDKLDQVMSLYGNAVNELKDTVSKKEGVIETLSAERDQYKSRVEEQSSQLDELNNKVKNGEDLSDTINALKVANQEKDEQHRQEIEQVKLNYEISNALTVAGAKNSKAVLALINSDEIKLSQEGHGLIGLDEQLEQLKQTDEYLFNTSDNNNNSSSNNAGNEYNPGTIKGNPGNGNNNEVAIGRAAAERLFKK
ncbi:phage scaffolding protein [Mammaliicoccus sciuri]|uniref:phage scaffolding protein n=1 Tax=Mammaliicoccus sciuri TaxID=1296 RepID=UPI001D0CF752|nr:phage scaffolding protein [Mammaliicoccus sciuri]MCC2087894.1 phage scaffolding protein [Mammaliicoccus sciuri]